MIVISIISKIFFFIFRISIFRMALAPYENLKGFASSRPPLVVFMVCIGMFAVVLLTLAYYVRVHEIQNPDVSQVSVITTLVELNTFS